MSKKTIIKHKNYISWGKEKLYGKETFWSKSNYREHVVRHEKIWTDELTFLETLSDPDVIYQDLYFDTTFCYYRFNSFGKGIHSQVIVSMEPTGIYAPQKGDYAIVKTAMDRDNIPENRTDPKFSKKKRK